MNLLRGFSEPWAVALEALVSQAFLVHSEQEAAGSCQLSAG